MGRPRPITPEQGDEILAKYEAGESRNSLADQYGASRRFLTNYLKERGARVRQCAEICATVLPRGNVFADALTNPESAYWVGFLMADGCISDTVKNRNPAIILVLAAKDTGHVQKLADFIGVNTVRVNKRPAGGQSEGYDARYTVTNRPMSDTLISYGVTPRKTHTAKVCDGLSMSPDFWRGYMDGNGTIRYIKRGNHLGACLSVCGGSEAILNQFATFARSHVEAVCRVFMNKGAWTVNIQGSRTAVPLVRLMYGHGGVSLDRKQVVADDMMARTWRKMGFGFKDDLGESDGDLGGEPPLPQDGPEVGQPALDRERGRDHMDFAAALD